MAESSVNPVVPRHQREAGAPRDSIDFAKGHGTENDFVLIPDVDDRLVLGESDVRKLCDRHAGIGGDGIIRVVRRNAATDAETGVPDDLSAEWFMDYRNADGSIAQMCGNGVRVFARYLQLLGLVDHADLAVITRSGVKTVAFEDDGLITVDMGPARDLGFSSTTVRVGDMTVECRGRAVSMGNPHLTCDLAGVGVAVDGLDLTRQPVYDGSFFTVGANLEFYEHVEPGSGARVAEYDAHVRMRVHERGVGETRSCGTGICAVAYAALAGLGRERGSVIVDVPGGRLYTNVTPERILLRGAAVIVAAGTTDLAARA